MTGIIFAVFALPFLVAVGLAAWRIRARRHSYPKEDIVEMNDYTAEQWERNFG